MPVVAPYRRTVKRIPFRGDAVKIYELLEAEGIEYAIRVPAKQVLQERISPLLWRPVHHQTAEVAIPRQLFAAAAIVKRIAALRSPPIATAT